MVGERVGALVGERVGALVGAMVGALVGAGVGLGVTCQHVHVHLLLFLLWAQWWRTTQPNLQDALGDAWFLHLGSGVPGPCAPSALLVVWNTCTLPACDTQPTCLQVPYLVGVIDLSAAGAVRTWATLAAAAAPMRRKAIFMVSERKRSARETKCCDSRAEGPT